MVKNSNPEPLVSSGRRIVKKYYRNGVWFRLELVPCRSPRCNKNPDEHGPYWYKYKKDGNSWRIKYLGYKRPRLVAYTVEELQEKFLPFVTKCIFSRSQRDKISNLMVELRRFKDTDVRANHIYEEIQAILVRDEKIRNEAPYRIFGILLARVQFGKKLTKKQKKQFDAIANMLASEH